MKHRISVSLALAGLAAAAAANAQQADDESGYYLGAGVGSFDVKIDDFDDVDDTIDRYDSDDTAWRAFGGWRANENLALELAYVNLGSPDDEILPGFDLTVETDGFAPYVVGTLPIGWFEAFAKAGYYWYEIEARLHTPDGTLTEDDNGETFTWSAGVGVNLLERFNIRLEYEQFDFDETDDSKALWLTGAIRF